MQLIDIKGKQKKMLLHLSIHFYQQLQMKYRKLFSLPYQ